jgi:glycosyltransferase involved in cell wall biosynthesis
MNRRTRVLFVRTANSSFIEKDLDLLRKHFNVKVVDYSGKKKAMHVVKGVLWADITFSWFAGSHAALAVLFSRVLRKKAIVVTGGYDVANEPSIDYGIMRFPRSRDARIVKFVLGHADLILPFSNFSMREVLKHSRPRQSKVLYCCADTEKFKPGSGKLNDLAVTVGLITNDTLRRKGFETFVKSAGFLPEIRFVLIGEHLDDSGQYLRSIAGPNVTFTGFVPFDKLLEYLQKAKVYVQISAQEGFGVALAEAMSCECVPVVTERGAIPEVVGDTGFYVAYDNPQATAKAIAEALKSDKGKKARERIIANFSLEKREAGLLKTISELS